MKKINHKFQITRKDLDEITREDNIEYLPNKKRYQLKGDYVGVFKQFVNIIENEEVSLQKRNSSFYKADNGEKNKVYLRINADCKNCPKTSEGVHYVFIINNKPNENEKFVDVLVEIKNDHNHTTKKAKKQYRGEEREKVSKAIIEAGGANAYVLEQIGQNKPAPTRAAARKMLSSYKNKGFTTDWLYNIHATADSFEAMTSEQKLTGFIQQIITHKEFAMYNYCQEQIDVLHNVPDDNRVAFFDATGNLVRIPKDKREYSRMLTHSLLIKDSRQIMDNISRNGKSSVVAEMSTTRQDVYRISDFFRCLKTDYENLYSGTLKFRLIVCDYAWASMHSIVEAFNDQKMEEYSKKVWQLSKGEVEPNSQTWLISCTSHTMKRYVKMTKSVVNKSMLAFCSYLFSLLVNCLDIESISMYFKLICKVFLYEKKSVFVIESLNALQEAISCRPTDKNEIKKLVENHLKTTNFEDIANKKAESIVKGKEKKTRTIADNSPFTKHFENIKSSITNEMENLWIDESLLVENNHYYCPEFIDHLLKRYMPYCFIWSGFVIRGLNDENKRTRFTNGTVENYFFSKKVMGQSFLRLLPAQYANKSYKLVIGKCKEFVSELTDNNFTNSDEDESQDEEDRLKSRERWSKRQKLELPYKNNNYQSGAKLDLAKVRVSKDILVKARLRKNKKIAETIKKNLKILNCSGKLKLNLFSYLIFVYLIFILR